MKLVYSALLSLLSFTANAQMLGTKQGGTIAMDASSGSGPMPFIQMLVALLIVIGILKFLMPKLASKYAGRLSLAPTSNLQIEESAHFAGGTLYLVKAKGKTLLLGVGPSITCLADLSDQPVAAKEATFEEFVDRAIIAEVDSNPAPADGENHSMAEILRRIEQLGA